MKRRVAVLVLCLAAGACRQPALEATTTSHVPAPVTVQNPAAPTTSTASTTSTISANTTSTPSTQTKATVTLGATLPAAMPRTSIPWSEVDENWLIVLYEGIEADVLYLVSPASDLYEIVSWDPGSHPPSTLTDWSPDKRRVLVRRFNPLPAPSIELLLIEIATGRTTVIESVPAALETGPMENLWGKFTQPRGFNLMVFSATDAGTGLDRRTPAGTVLATFGTVGPWLNSPSGSHVVIGDNNGLHLYRNDGVFLRDLISDSATVPIRWWSDDHVLVALRGYGNPLSRGHASWDDISLAVVDLHGKSVPLDGRSGVSLAEVYQGAWPVGDRTVIETGQPLSSHAQYFWVTGAHLAFNDDKQAHRVLNVVDDQLIVLAFDHLGDQALIGRYPVDSAPEQPLKRSEVLVPHVGSAKGVVEVLHDNGVAGRQSDRWPLPRAVWPGYTLALVGEDPGGFEAYEPGWYPYRDGWFRTDRGAAAAQVSAERAHTGDKSFRLPVNPDVVHVQGRMVEAIGDLGIRYTIAVNCSSAGPIGVVIGFYDSVGDEECPECEGEFWNAIRFEQDGTIAVVGSLEADRVSLSTGSSWSRNTWYVVSAVVDFEKETTQFWANGRLLAAGVPAAPRSDHTAFGISVFPGTLGAVYVDDVSIDPVP